MSNVNGGLPTRAGPPIKGTCQVCERECSITKKGTLFKHNPDLSEERCLGSFSPPYESDWRVLSLYISNLSNKAQVLQARIKNIQEGRVSGDLHDLISTLSETQELIKHHHKRLKAWKAP